MFGLPPPEIFSEDQQLCRFKQCNVTIIAAELSEKGYIRIVKMCMNTGGFTDLKDRTRRKYKIFKCVRYDMNGSTYYLNLVIL